MRFEHLQVDVADVSPRGAKTVEVELNVFAEKLEKNGYGIVEEAPYPQTGGVRAFFTILYDKPSKNKGAIVGTRYVYKIYDVRDGHATVTKYLNEEAVRLEGEGREIIRMKALPTRNSAFTQALLVHVPSENKVETVVEPTTPVGTEPNKEEKTSGGIF